MSNLALRGHVSAAGGFPGGELLLVQNAFRARFHPRHAFLGAAAFVTLGREFFHFRFLCGVEIELGKGRFAHRGHVFVTRAARATSGFFRAQRRELKQNCSEESRGQERFHDGKREREIRFCATFFFKREHSLGEAGRVFARR